MLEKFIKKAFISFYEDEKFYFLLEITRNKKLIYTEFKTFSNKKELEEKIFNIQEDYPQTYISTIIDTNNQGITPTCDKKFFLEKNIKIEDIKLICIKNYALFVFINDLLEFKKKFDFEIDFIYSIFAPIDFYVKNKNNYFYLLILKTKIAIIGYHKNIPIYYKIVEEKDEKIDIIEDIIEEIEIEEIDEIVKILKPSIKEYYENFSDEFLEKIVILDTINIKKELKNKIEEELFIPTEIVNFNILKILNKMSIENV